MWQRLRGGSIRDVQRLGGRVKHFAGCARSYACGRYGSKCRDVQRLGLRAARKRVRNKLRTWGNPQRAQCRDVQRLAKLARHVQYIIPNRRTDPAHRDTLPAGDSDVPTSGFQELKRPFFTLTSPHKNRQASQNDPLGFCTDPDPRRGETTPGPR